MDRRDFLKTAAGSGYAMLVASALTGVPTALRGEQMQDASQSSRALAELQNVLAELDRGFSAPDFLAATPADRAEGRSFMLHVLHHAIECWLEADPDRPVFKRFVTPEKRLLGCNPDGIYYTTAARAGNVYRIRGNLAGATYTAFTVELGTADGNASTGLGAVLNDTQFEAAADGSYELIASTEKRPGNWLPLPEGTGSITTRHYYEQRHNVATDRLHHVPIAIEPVETAAPPPPPTDASIAAGIARVTNFVRGTVAMSRPDAMPPGWVSTVPNQVAQPSIEYGNQDIGFAAKDNVYASFPYALKPDQALVVGGAFPRCRFANVVLWNRFLQAFDYRNRTSSLNRKQIVLADDGRFEIVIAHEDPGVANWLDTGGRPHGQVFWRFQLPEEEIPPLSAEVVPTARLAG
jgi:hypothetical protein